MVECTGNMGCGETVTVTADEVIVYAFFEGFGAVEVGVDGPDSVKEYIRSRPRAEHESLLRELEHSLKTATPAPHLPFDFLREQRPREVTVPAQFDGDEDAAVAAGWVLSEFGLRCPKCELADGGDTATLEPLAELTAALMDGKKEITEIYPGTTKRIARTDAIARIDELRSLQDGWLDGEGKAIDQRAADAAVAFLKKSHSYFGSKFDGHIYPTFGGGIQFEFDDREVEFSADGSMEERKDA